MLQPEDNVNSDVGSGGVNPLIINNSILSSYLDLPRITRQCWLICRTRCVSVEVLFRDKTTLDARMALMTLILARDLRSLGVRSILDAARNTG